MFSSFQICESEAVQFVDIVKDLIVLDLRFAYQSVHLLQKMIIFRCISSLHLKTIIFTIQSNVDQDNLFFVHFILFHSLICECFNILSGLVKQIEISICKPRY